jgi:hypothetical protein
MRSLEFDLENVAALEAAAVMVRKELQTATGLTNAEFEKLLPALDGVG